MPTARLDVYAVAHLAGGPGRAVDAALTALVQTGRVRVDDAGGLTVADPHRRHPVESAVLDAIGSRHRRSAGTVRFRAASDARLAEVAARLTTDGLLSARGRCTLAGRRALRRLRSAPPADPLAAGTDAVVVALSGSRMLPDPRLRAALTGPERRRRRNAAHWEPRAEAAWAMGAANPFGGQPYGAATGMSASGGDAIAPGAGG